MFGLIIEPMIDKNSGACGLWIIQNHTLDVTYSVIQIFRNFKGRQLLPPDSEPRAMIPSPPPNACMLEYVVRNKCISFKIFWFYTNIEKSLIKLLRIIFAIYLNVTKVLCRTDCRLMSDKEMPKYIYFIDRN